jgi:hypothetical protein
MLRSLWRSMTGALPASPLCGRIPAGQVCVPASRLSSQLATAPIRGRTSLEDLSFTPSQLAEIERRAERYCTFVLGENDDFELGDLSNFTLFALYISEGRMKRRRQQKEARA